jgi:hypothetical protein
MSSNEMRVTVVYVVLGTRCSIPIITSIVSSVRKKRTGCTDKTNLTLNKSVASSFEDIVNGEPCVCGRGSTKICLCVGSSRVQCCRLGLRVPFWTARLAGLGVLNSLVGTSSQIFRNGVSLALGLLRNSILTMESKDFGGLEDLCCDQLAVVLVIRDCRLLGSQALMASSRREGCFVYGESYGACLLHIRNSGT